MPRVSTHANRVDYDGELDTYPVKECNVKVINEVPKKDHYGSNSIKLFHVDKCIPSHAPRLQSKSGRAIPRVSWDEIYPLDSETRLEQVSSSTIHGNETSKLNTEEIGTNKAFYDLRTKENIESHNFLKYDRNNDDSSRSIKEYEIETTQEMLVSSSDKPRENPQIILKRNIEKNKNLCLNEEKSVNIIKYKSANAFIDDNTTKNYNGINMKRVHGGRLEPYCANQVGCWRNAENLSRDLVGPKLSPIKIKDLNSNVHSTSNDSPTATNLKRLPSQSPSSKIRKKQRIDEESTGENVISPKLVEKLNVKSRHYNQEDMKKYVVKQRYKRKEAHEREEKLRKLQKEKIDANLKNLEEFRKNEVIKPKVNLPTREIKAKSSKENQPPWDKEWAVDSSSKYRSHTTNEPFKPISTVDSGVQCDTLIDNLVNNEKMLPMEISKPAVRPKSIYNEPSASPSVKKSGRNRAKLKTSHHSDSEDLGKLIRRIVEKCDDAVSSSSNISAGSIPNNLRTESTETEKTIPQKGDKERRIAEMGDVIQKLTKTIDDTMMKFPLKRSMESKHNYSDDAVDKQEVKSRGIRDSLSFSRIESMSVEELIKRMRSVLPEKVVKPTKREDAIFASKNKHLSNDGENVNKIQTHHTKSTNEDVCNDQPDARSRFVPKSYLITPTQNLNFKEDSHFNPYLKSSEFGESNASSIPPNLYRSREIKAAVKIQAFYRGYRVRKVTNMCLSNVYPKRYNREISIDNNYGNSNPPIDWVELRKRLERESSIHPIPYISEAKYHPKYSPTTTPDIVKPNNAPSSSVDLRSYRKKEISAPVLNPSAKYNDIIQPSNMLPTFTDKSKSPRHQSRSKYPESKQIPAKVIDSNNRFISHTDKRVEDLREDGKYFKHDSKSVGTKKQSTSAQTIPTFEELFEREIDDRSIMTISEVTPPPLMHSFNSHMNINQNFVKDAEMSSGNSIASISSISKYESSNQIQDESPTKNPRCSSFVEETCLENFPIDSPEIENSKVKNKLFDELKHSKSNESLDLPHNFLGLEGPHMGPSMLSSRVNVELLYQDTINSALGHLEDLESLRKLSNSQITAKNSEKPVGEGINLRKFEVKQTKLDKKSNAFEQHIEEIERKAKEQFSKYEQKLKERTDDLMNNMILANKDLKLNETSHAIAAATSAAVEAGISTVWDKMQGNIATHPQSSVNETRPDHSSQHLKSAYSNSFYSSDSQDADIRTFKESTISGYSRADENETEKSTSKILTEPEENKELFRMDNIKDSSRNDSSPNNTVGISIEEEVADDNMELQDDESEEIISLSIEEDCIGEVSLGPVESSIAEVVEQSNNIKRIYDSDPSIISTAEHLSECTSFRHDPGGSHTSTEEIDEISSEENHSFPLATISSKSVFTSINNGSKTILTSYSKASLLANSTVDTSATYSESFEPESASSDHTDKATNRRSSQLSLQKPGAASMNNMTVMQVAAANLTEPKFESPGQADSLDLQLSGFSSQMETPRAPKGALRSTLSLMDSLQKEEEIRFNHQKALLKLQEQALVEEAKLRISSLQLEAGPTVRKKQRAILLQLREQRAHIKRLIETQNLAAQQRRLIFLQHHHLLSSTTTVSNALSSRLLPSRVHSPITSRNFDPGFSSSDAPDNALNMSNPLSIRTESETLSDDDLSTKELDDKKGKIKEDKEKLNIISIPNVREKDWSMMRRKDDRGWKRKEKLFKAALPSKIKKRIYDKSPSIESTADEDMNDSNVASFVSIESTENYSKGDSDIKVSSDISEDVQTNEDIETVVSTEESELAEVIETSVDLREEEEKINSITERNVSDDIKTISNSMTRETQTIDHDSRNSNPSSDKTLRSSLVTKSDSYSVDKANSDSEMIIPRKVSHSSSSRVIMDKSKHSKDESQDESLKSVSRESFPFTLRFPLSPRSKLRQAWRYSSESDDSFTLSQTETASDLSDGEGRLAALRGELAQRKAEAEQLQKERRKLRREKLMSQEQALRAQIETYDSYIRQTRRELEKDTRELILSASVKPLIKKPRAAFKKKTARQDSSNDHSMNDLSLVENSIQETIHEDKEDYVTENSLNADETMGCDQTRDSLSSSNSSTFTSNRQNSEIVNMDEVEILEKVYEHMSSSKETDSIIEDDSESISTEIQSSYNVKLDDFEANSRTSDDKESPNETDQSISQESSTDTIRYSPKVLDESKGDYIKEPASTNVEDIADKIVDKNLAPSKPKNNEIVDTTSPKINENLKLDIFIPIVKDDIFDDKDDDQTITEDICEELPIDDEEFDHIADVSNETDIKLDLSIKKTPTLDKSDGGTPNNVEGIADGIVKILLNDAIDSMLKIMKHKEDQIRQIDVQIEKSPDASLKSENKLSENLCSDTSDIISKCSSREINSAPTRPHFSKEFPVSTHLRESLPSSSDTSTSDIANYDANLFIMTPPGYALVPAIVRDSSQYSYPSVHAENIERYESFEEGLISPLRCPQPDKNRGIDPEELSAHLLSVQNAETALDDTDGINQDFNVKSSQGNWYDDDFWVDQLALDKLQLKIEDERLQAQIAREEELEQFRQLNPGLIIREIPNKPPPPYVPPASESSSATYIPAGTTAEAKVINVSRLSMIPENIVNKNRIPSDEKVILSIIEMHFNFIFEEWQYGKNPKNVQNPEWHNSSPNHDELNGPNCYKIFHYLMFCLTREILCDAYDAHHRAPDPFWHVTNFQRMIKPWQRWTAEPTREGLHKYLISKVGVFLGFVPSSQKESTMVKWMKRRGELPDQLLISETQSEEANWTAFDREEDEVKMQLTNEILEDLLSDTTKLFDRIIKNKLNLQISVT